MSSGNEEDIDASRDTLGSPEASSDTSGSQDSNDSDTSEDPDPEISKAFWLMFNTVLNHRYPDGKWKKAQKSTLFYIINDKKPVKVQKKIKDKDHTEEILISRLRDRQSRSTKSIQVTVYSNNSPCWKCADALLRFLTENKNYTLTFYVAHLFNIRRQSCIKKQESHLTSSYLTKETSDTNIESLCKLMENGCCQIEAFRKETWTNLMDILKLQDEKDTFDEKYEEKQDDDDRSRKKEDGYVYQDLGHLFGKYVFEYMFFIGLDDDDSSFEDAVHISHLVYRVNKNKAEKIKYEVDFGNKMMQNLEKTYDGQPMLVNIFTGRSPSYRDTKLLRSFLKEKRLAEVTIYVANLFEIRRNSCKAEPHYEDVSEERSTKNSDGLRELMDHRRCELKAFNEATWEDLMYTLNIEDENFSQNYRKRYDGYHRSRKREDERIKEDLECIYKGET